MLHGTIPACMVAGSAHHVYLLKQPFQLRLQGLLLLLQCLLRRPHCTRSVYRRRDKRLQPPHP